MSDLKTTEFVFIRLDELNEMRADLRALDALRAKWDAVPWDEINDALLIAERTHLFPIAEQWYWDNVPKEQP